MIRSFIVAFGFVVFFTNSAFANPCEVGGQVYDLRVGSNLEAIELGEFANRLKGIGSPVLVGERHGVREHPKAFACLLQNLTGTNLINLGETRPASVVLEHLSISDQPLIDLYRKQHPEQYEELGFILRWWESGWPAWPVYSPAFEMIWKSRSQLVAGDLPDDTPEASAGSGEKARERKFERTAFEAQRPLAFAKWQDAMTEAHCGLIDEIRSADLAFNQMRRDRHMAERMEPSILDGDISLFFGGRAHVRKDRAIPTWLDVDSISVALWEKQDGLGEKNQAEILAQNVENYDFIWFVGETQKVPACERLRAKGLIPATSTQQQ